MTRSSKAPSRELELIPFQLLKKLTSLRMMLLFSSPTPRFKLQLLQTHGLLAVLLRPKNWKISFLRFSANSDQTTWTI
uniref:Uncharacterized protein n=1 Tax=Brassica oleracea TaxID=3712 RepID=A0A3P6GYC8_BRAOL|nr:unnamed protein product [Brassica oleracea]